MKTLIGIDTQGNYRPVLGLFARLQFDSPDVTLVHVVDPTLPYPTFEMVPFGEVSADYVKALNEAAEKALEDAADEACGFGIRADTLLLSGPAAPMLAEQGEEMKADLLAVSATRKSKLGSLFLGSVSRGLAINARQSILVAKGEVGKTGPVTAVLATDHSLYANKCIDRMLELKPKGIKKFIVLTAYELSDYEAALLHANIPMLGAQADDWIEENLAERSCELVEKLAQHGYPAEHRVVKANANEAIRELMNESDADLLIIGAQGHGFIDRLFIGSVSFHQVVAEPYPVFVVRV